MVLRAAREVCRSQPRRPAVVTCPRCNALPSEGQARCPYCGAAAAVQFGGPMPTNTRRIPPHFEKKTSATWIGLAAELLVGLLLGSGATVLVVRGLGDGDVGGASKRSETTTTPGGAVRSPGNSGSGGAAEWGTPSPDSRLGSSGRDVATDETRLTPEEEDQKAGSILRNALSAEKIYYVDTAMYTEDPSYLSALENALSGRPSRTVYRSTCSAAGDV